MPEILRRIEAKGYTLAAVELREALGSEILSPFLVANSTYDAALTDQARVAAARQKSRGPRARDFFYPT